MCDPWLMCHKLRLQIGEINLKLMVSAIIRTFIDSFLVAILKHQETEIWCWACISLSPVRVERCKECLALTCHGGCRGWVFPLWSARRMNAGYLLRSRHCNHTFDRILFVIHGEVRDFSRGSDLVLALTAWLWWLGPRLFGNIRGHWIDFLCAFPGSRNDFLSAFFFVCLRRGFSEYDWISKVFLNWGSTIFSRMRRRLV